MNQAQYEKQMTIARLKRHLRKKTNELRVSALIKLYGGLPCIPPHLLPKPDKYMVDGMRIGTIAAQICTHFDVPYLGTSLAQVIIAYTDHRVNRVEDFLMMERLAKLDKPQRAVYEELKRREDIFNFEIERNFSLEEDRAKFNAWLETGEGL